MVAELEWNTEDVSPEGEDEFTATTEDDTEYVPPTSDIPGFSAIFGAPDFTRIIKTSQTKRSRQYETSVQSLIKAGVISALKHDNFPDAAAGLKHGPAFARAVGDAADESPRVRGIVDMITAPDSAMVPLALTSIALFSQLLRNHQSQAEHVVESVKKTRRERRELKKRIARGEVINDSPTAHTTIKLPFGRKITLKWKIKIPGVSSVLSAMTSTSVPPIQLAYEVFSDEELVAALEKQGIKIKQDSRNG